MSTLYRLKAYFGMVPAEDMDAYLDYDDEPGYYEDRRPDYPEPRGGSRAESDSRLPERVPPERHYPDRRYEQHPTERRAADRPMDRQVDRHPERLTMERHAERPSLDPVGAGHSAPVHGALAIEPMVASKPNLAEVPRRAPSVADAEPLTSAGGKQVPLSRITTVHPRSYDEARTIGERYRDGIPVIINLTELDDAAAKRLVDFAAGLAFALRGSIDKITSRVFLLSPVGVEVSAEDRRRLAERGFFGQV
ncbi:cell division protein SepF [Pseudonocardia eucalypti]|uniref:Cell division protein SepF n=1 Tax=Pseudonocardia eucalypti TaxID=648755 RepID=A0ABP9QVQ5_9PSEU|nr:cell division inhibitor SepF [Pseudonocardia eucalypti]